MSRVLWIMMAFVLCSIPAYAQEDDQFHIIEVQGKVRYRPKGQMKIIVPKEGQSLRPGGKMRLREHQSIRLESPMGDQLQFKDKTYFTLHHWGKGGAFKGELKFGHLNVRTVPRLNRDIVFQVKTPAAVVGVRGTEFTIIVTPGGATSVEIATGELFVDGNEEEDAKPLKPGQKALISPAGKVTLQKTTAALIPNNQKVFNKASSIVVFSGEVELETNAGGPYERISLQSGDRISVDRSGKSSPVEKLSTEQINRLNKSFALQGRTPDDVEADALSPGKKRGTSVVVFKGSVGINAIKNGVESSQLIPLRAGQKLVTDKSGSPGMVERLSESELDKLNKDTSMEKRTTAQIDTDAVGKNRKVSSKVAVFKGSVSVGAVVNGEEVGQPITLAEGQKLESEAGGKLGQPAAMGKTEMQILQGSSKLAKRSSDEIEAAKDEEAMKSKIAVFSGSVAIKAVVNGVEVGEPLSLEKGQKLESSAGGKLGSPQQLSATDMQILQSMSKLNKRSPEEIEAAKEEKALKSKISVFSGSVAVKAVVNGEEVGQEISLAPGEKLVSEGGGKLGETQKLSQTELTALQNSTKLEKRSATEIEAAAKEDTPLKSKLVVFKGEVGVKAVVNGEEIGEPVVLQEGQSLTSGADGDVGQPEKLSPTQLESLKSTTQLEQRSPEEIQAVEQAIAKETAESSESQEASEQEEQEAAAEESESAFEELEQAIESANEDIQNEIQNEIDAENEQALKEQGVFLEFEIKNLE